MSTLAAETLPDIRLSDAPILLMTHVPMLYDISPPGISGLPKRAESAALFTCTADRVPEELTFIQLSFFLAEISDISTVPEFLTGTEKIYVVLLRSRF